MKKLFIICMFFSSFCYGQEKNELQFNFSIGVRLDCMSDIKLDKYGGIGVDLYQSRIDNFGWGLYYVSPNINTKNYIIDFLFGVGKISEIETYQKYQSVNGYYTSNGTFVNSYVRRNGYGTKYVNSKSYKVVGVGISVPFKNLDMGVSTKTVVRILPNKIISPDLQLGFYFSL